MNLKKRLIPKKIRSSFLKKEVGSAPGTLTHIGAQKIDTVTIDIHDYGLDHLTTASVDSVANCRPYVATSNPTWVQVKGLHDIPKLKELWDEFDFHPLIQEDILNTTQRPKIEDYTNQIFIVLKMLYLEDGVLEQEQVSIVLSDKFVFSFQESDKPIFAPIKERLKVENTRMRKNGCDYMAYALMDVIIDYYFEALGELNSQIEAIEDMLWEGTDDISLTDIHTLRRQLITFRKSVWPLRDNINSFYRDESPLLGEETKLFLRDTSDHTSQIVDTLDNNREMISSLHDMYQTNLSNKMNEVMKVLTIIATIFIPLTFIAGIYGMNFEHMPELAWEYSYPTIWGIMIVATIGMVFYFRKKKWI
ncbi:magnesium/cobalt transporter CorA [Balneola vulgaris]|uniref:magnesium/cobalt transporter CorA n=1 Tax=Balneola vulgaris TaxID=287535 RepID=UPI00035E91CF|nr:magnesium/cobalt transporter CorA [Balneola vulgaris]